jgi:hypothetical protein
VIDPKHKLVKTNLLITLPSTTVITILVPHEFMLILTGNKPAKCPQISILKSKVCLELLLKVKYVRIGIEHWFGYKEDFHATLGVKKSIPFSSMSQHTLVPLVSLTLLQHNGTW